MIYTKCKNCGKGTAFDICTCGYDKVNHEMLSPTTKFLNRYLSILVLLGLTIALTLANIFIK